METHPDSVPLQQFVRLLQLQAGQLAGANEKAIAALFRPVVDAVPRTLTISGVHVLQVLLIQTVAQLDRRLRTGRQDGELAAQVLTLCSAADVDQLTATFRSYLYRLEQISTSSPATARDRRVVKAVAYIRLNSHRSSLALSDVAQAVRLSTWHLDRLLRRHTGWCYRRHLLHARMQQATRLLQGTTLSIKEIAAAVGYSYATEFAHRFKQAFHVTPTVWRARMLAAGGHDGIDRPEAVQLTS